MLHWEIGLIFPGDGVPFSLPLSELLLLPGVQMGEKKKKKLRLLSHNIFP